MCTCRHLRDTPGGFITLFAGIAGRFGRHGHCLRADTAIPAVYGAACGVLRRAARCIRCACPFPVADGPVPEAGRAGGGGAALDLRGPAAKMAGERGSFALLRRLPIPGRELLASGPQLTPKDSVSLFDGVHGRADMFLLLARPLAKVPCTSADSKRVQFIPLPSQPRIEAAQPHSRGAPGRQACPWVPGRRGVEETLTPPSESGRRDPTVSELTPPALVLLGRRRWPSPAAS